MDFPRIITVDPSLSISRLLRSALDLLDLSVTQVDVPNSKQAMAELKAGCDMVLTAFSVDEHTRGFELAARIKMESPATAVIVLGDLGDPDEFDEETADESPFVYLSRPLDPSVLLRVIEAGLDGRDIKAALVTPGTAATPTTTDLGPVPVLDTNAARPLIDSLLGDVTAMGVILADREGSILVESGAVGYVNREQLTASVIPAVLSTMDVRDIVGGNISTVQFFDGDDYDVFVLSVGLHHFMCVLFDGTNGSRQFGGVNRYGRRVAEDLVALLGANAFIVQRVKPEEKKRRTRTSPQAVPQEEEYHPLERAVLDDAASGEALLTPEPEPQLDPIAASEDDLAALFGGGDVSVDDDLFDLDDLEELAKENLGSRRGTIGRKQAEELDLL